MRRILPREFYERDPAEVAVNLLGMVMVRRLSGGEKACAIVETEAYYGPEDPASRASRHKRGRIVEALRGPVGYTLVYGIHRQWLLNIIAHPPGGWGAVLLRACMPLTGMDEKTRTNGPGLLTRALHIDRKLSGIPVYGDNSLITVEDWNLELDTYSIQRGWRIGVARDLDVPLRFCLGNNPYISKPCHLKKRNK